MFPYVCLSTMPLFCDFDWPKKCMNKIFRKINMVDTGNVSSTGATKKIGFKEKLVAGLILSYCGLQGFLPYSHFITKVSEV